MTAQKAREEVESEIRCVAVYLCTVFLSTYFTSRMTSAYVCFAISPTNWRIFDVVTVTVGVT